MKLFRKKIRLRIIFYLVAIMLLILYLILCHFGYGIPCFFNYYFGYLCPGCGATRAFFSLIALDFSAAGAFHPIFAFAVYPIALFLLLQDFILALYNLYAKREKLSLLRFLFGGREKPCS